MSYVLKFASVAKPRAETVEITTVCLGYPRSPACPRIGNGVVLLHTSIASSVGHEATSLVHLTLLTHYRMVYNED
jgi:hypothetical protein